MPLPKMMLAIAACLIMAIGGYYLAGYERNAYAIRKQWEQEREEGMRKQAEQIEKETAARQAAQR